MQKFQKQIDRINARYDYEKDKIVNQIRDEYIVPYCNKHKLQFYSGMGSWVFFKHGTDHFSLSTDQDNENQKTRKTHIRLPEDENWLIVK